MDPCPALPGPVFALPQGHIAWLCPRATCCGLTQSSARTPSRRCRYLETPSALSAFTPACACSHCLCGFSASRREAKKQFAKHFQGTLASDSFSTACRTCMSDNTPRLRAQLLTSSQTHNAPRHLHEGSCPGCFTSHLQNMIDLAFLLFF